MIFKDGSPFIPATKIQRIFMEYKIQFIFNKKYSICCVNKYFKSHLEKHLMMIEELFWFNTQFHWMMTLQITRQSTCCVFCSTSETCWVNKLTIMFCWAYVSPCDTLLIYLFRRTCKTWKILGEYFNCKISEKSPKYLQLICYSEKF